MPNAPFLAPPELAYADALKLASGGSLDHNIVERTIKRRRALRAADRGEVEPLLQFKADRADRLRRTLTCASDVTVWGDIASFADSREPLVVIGGRCDFRIKGHDVAAAVAATRAAQRKRGRWLFLLIPQSRTAETDLMELRAVAEKSGGRVLVIPSVWRAGYLDALESAAFCLFPSTIEPFGGVSEPVYLGTPVVARATGGLVDQIVPLQGAVVYDREVEIRTRHHQNAAPTGILYREHPRSRSEWERLLSLAGAPIAEKWRDPVFGDLVDALDRAIDDAIAVWDDPVLYGELVANGIRHLRQHFTWRKTAAGYLSQARLDQRAGFLRS